MSITHILADLRQRNITVRTEGNDLRVIADKGALSPEVRALLASHKQEILKYLRRLDEDETAEITPLKNRGPLLPLSFGQHRLWFLAQLEPASSAYVIPAAVRIRGPLDSATLVDALDQVVLRHEVLRTVFVTDDGHPAQKVLDQMPIPFSLIDLRQGAGPTQAEIVEQWVRTEATRPFDLAAGPLLRATLLQLADREHVLLLALHHIAADGWSIEVLVRELSAFYLAFQASRPAELLPLPVQYADYAAWQQRWQESPSCARQLAYWRKQLADLVPLALPTDHPRLDRNSSRGASARFVVPSKLASRLRVLGLEEEATLFMVLLAAFQLLLSRYSGQQQIAVGTPVANRERKEIEGLIGFFVNTLVLFVDTGRPVSVRKFLGQVRKTALDAFENQDLPFEQLVDELQPARSLNQNPLFQVMFMLQNVPRSEVQLGEITLQPFSVDTQAAKFDLTLGLSEDGGQLQGWLNYNAELFEPATVARMAEHYCILLNGMVERSQHAVSELSLLAEGERRQLLVDWNSTHRAYPQDRSIHQFFESQARKTPSREALIFEGEKLSYAELNVRANQAARYLQKLGVGPETAVGICLERGFPMMVALLGTLKAGSAYVPLDPSYPAARLAFMLQDAGIKVLLTQEKFLPSFANSELQTVCLDLQWTDIEKEDKANLDVAVDRDSLAYIIYTSGSTGVPKGAMNTHGAIANRLIWMQEEYGLSEFDRVMQKTPISFDVSVWELFWPLMTGATLVLAQPDGHRDSDYLVNLIACEKITTLHFVPSMLRVFLENSCVDRCTSLRRVIASGEALSSDLVSQFYAKLGAGLHNLYGPTEAAVDVTFWPCPKHVNGAGVSIGRPIANLQIYILDQEMQLVPVGVAGELYIGGAGLARGYLHRPALTAERFVPDHLGGRPGDRLYRTGDKARWLVDGNLDYLGRIDDQVKIRGHRIELGEIEAVLAQHQAVKQAVVVVHEHQPGDKRLVAYVVWHNKTTGAINALRDYLRERLPEYMAPAAIIEIEELPLSPNGKIDRKALPAPEYRGSEEQIAPRNAEEEILCGIFAEVLKLERVGVEQNFFNAGGHSLLATQVVSRIKSVLGVDLPLRALFEAPTVSGLRERVERARHADVATMPPLVRASRGVVIPLSFAQQRLWFLDQFQPGSSTYNSSVALHLHGDLELGALEWALSEIVRRHEILRTRMEALQGQPRQMIAEATTISIPITDLSAFETGEREARLRSCMRDEAVTPFDLSRGPLLRIRLVRQGEQDHALLATMHHIVTDGWSTGIMVQELSRLYRAGVLGEKSPLAELPVQYADFAIWQREWLQGEVLERQTSYWKMQLAETPALEMPTDHPRSEVESEAGASLKWELPEDLGRKLHELSRREGATLFMTLLAAFHVLLSRHSGQDDIATGSPIAGRTRTELEGLIGFFANTLVLRSDLSGRPTFHEFLARAREMTLAAYAHQDVPFEKLVEELQPDRDLSRSPLFQAMFLLQNAPLGDLELPGIKLSIMERATETAHFELLLSAHEENGKIAGGLSYRTNLFANDSMRRLVDRWNTLLASIVNGPQKRIGELTMLSEAEHRQIVEEWNRTDMKFPQWLVHEMVEEHAAKQPLAIAVEHAGRQLTYADLNCRANQLAHYLRKRGAGPERLVGVCMERSLDMIVGVLAILKTGAAYVPLDPQYPSARLSYMIENSRIELLVLQEKFKATFSGHVQRAVCLDAEWPKISEESSANLNIAVDAENLAFVVYTSGSTGWPKGAALRHGHLANLIAWHLERVSESALRTLQFASLSFDVSFQDIFATLCAGACLVLIDEEARRDPVELWRTLCDQRVERVAVPFVALQQLAELAIRKPATSALRVLITSGEQLKTTPALQKLLHQLPGCALENQYGPSEAHVVTTYRLGKDPDAWAVLPPIGRPVANTQVYLLNEEFVPVPAGAAGEVFLAGDQLARGYVNRPELTAERFLPNPFSKQPGGRMYGTGDLGRHLADGNIEYLGRIDFQVKIRGYRVEVGEVESALIECEGVGQSAVVVREDRPGEKRLVAYVVARDGQQLSEDKLRNQLKARLPEFMVPAAVQVMEQFPLTPSGKIDRKRLPDPGASAPGTTQQYVGPRNATEEILCGIWEDLLKREPIGINRNFFEAGGHSLLAMQQVARIADALRVELPVRRLFESPTVAELAQVIEQLASSGGLENVSPIVTVSRDQDLPLSFAQQRLWFLDQLQPGSASYNLPAALQLSGAIRIDAVEQAFTVLIHRHESLRTTFKVRNGQPVQDIAPPETILFSLPLTDLSSLSPEAAEAEARRLAEDEAKQPFDLTTGPLLRVKMLRLAEQEHVLLVTMHHIVSDGWSMGIMVREFSRVYEACCKEGSPALPELPIQYADFSAWQQQWLQGAILDQQLDYWKQQLAGAQPLELPADRQRPALMNHKGANLAFSIDSSQAELLKLFSRQQGTTLYMVLLAAFQALLYRYSGQGDISIGSPIAGRRRTETEGLVGFFINTLVMRARPSGGLGFSEFLHQVREVTLGAYSHQDVPFEKVVEELQPERDLSRSPLFQVMFALQNAPRFELELEEVKLRPFIVDDQTAKFDLTMSLSEDQDKLQGWLGYYAEVFEPATIRRMIGHYSTLINSIAAAPGASLAELPLLEEAERHQLLVDWNTTQRTYPQDRLIHQFFEMQAKQTPGRVALIFEGEKLTYAELNSRANQAARHLQKLGVGPETAVGICLERSIPLMVALLGTLKAGAAYVPLDPNYPAARLAFMLHDAGIKVLLTQEKFLPSFADSDLRTVCLDLEWTDIEKEDRANLDLAVDHDSLAYIIYTSGSTGVPKGVMLQHRSAINLICWAHEVFTTDVLSRTLFSTSLNFDLSVYECFVPLTCGASIRIVANALDLAGGGVDVTLINTVPSVMKTLLEERTLPPVVKEINVAGEPLRRELVESIFARTEATHVCNLYGPTETTTYSTWVRMKREDGFVSHIGRPIANTRVYLLDKTMEIVPVRVEGEVYIAGAGVARGYLNRPELTAERFVPDPYSLQPGARMYKTGDVGKWLGDGNLEFLGRRDDQVKIRGFRIEMGEIESALRTQAAVRDVAIVAREYQPGDKRLVAYVVPITTGAEEGHPDFEHYDSSQLQAELSRSLARGLPAYMVPANFIFLDRLPLLPNGKLDRKALPSPEDPLAGSRAAQYMPPETPVEQHLAQIFSAILKKDRIGLHDNFFVLGGHSLLVFRLKTMMQDQFGCDLSLPDLFQDPTIAGLAKLVDGLAVDGPAKELSSSVLVPLQAAGSGAPFFCIHPIGGQVVCYSGLARELGKGRPFYGLQSPTSSPAEPSTIEQMATLYIDEIKRVQSSGPYLLGGWSMGGLVAFEMAHQLIAQGETIGLLAMFDTIPPAPSVSESGQGRGFSMLERFAFDMARLVLRNLDELREQFLQSAPEEQFQLLADALVREQVLSPETSKAELNRLLGVFTRNAQAMDNYCVTPIQQRIVLFPAAGREAPERLAHKWEAFTTIGVDVRPVPGDHYTVMKPPHVAVIAAELNKELNHL